MSASKRPALPALPGTAAEVVESLYQHRLLTAAQVQEMHAPHATLRFTQQLLVALERHGLVSSVRGGRGSPKLHFLTPAGAQAAERSAPIPGGSAPGGRFRGRTLCQVKERAIALLVGYARVSTDEQDLTAQRDALAGLGVSGERIYVDHGLTGRNLDRLGLREALAACREGDTLVVTKLDRLARSLPDARDILEGLTARQVKLSIGGSVHDPTDPVGRLLFNVLAMVAEFESDLIRLRTREGMKVARRKGRLRGNSQSSTHASRRT